MPATFFRANEALLLECQALGRTLDVACGRGRHALAARALGLDVLALDRNEDHLAELRARAADPTAEAGPAIEVRAVDLEGEAPPDLDGERFGSVLVFRYLHRPLMPWLESRLAPGGVLLYETFTVAQRSLGWGPSRDAFLLESGELPTLFPGLDVVHYEEGESGDAQPAMTARLVATRPR